MSVAETFEGKVERLSRQLCTKIKGNDISWKLFSDEVATEIVKYELMNLLHNEAREQLLTEAFE